jgi:hypothetical protein
MGHDYTTRASLIRHAVEIACESRSLSHGEVSSEIKGLLGVQAAELADRWGTADAIDIATELLRWLRKDAPVNRRVRHRQTA